jgi:hypothetical protein
MRRMNSKELASCEDDDDAGYDERLGDAAPTGWPRLPHRPAGLAKDSLAGLWGMGLRWRLCDN